MYLEIRILSVLGSISGDFFTRSWLRVRGLSSVLRSASPRTWRHGSAGTFCCHNKSGAGRIQYNRGCLVSLGLHWIPRRNLYVVVVVGRERAGGRSTTVNVAIPTELDGWLERNNPWQITYKEPLMVYVARLLLYTMMHCIASHPLFLNRHCFDSRWNKCGAFEGK